MPDARRLDLARRALVTAEAYQPPGPFERRMKATNVAQLRRHIAELEARLAHPAGQG